MITIEDAVARRRGLAGARGTSTPWGAADAATWFADGITFYSTPSHGGFRLSADRLAAMPPALQKRSLAYCGADWFEEDCEASLVVVAFPDHFTPDEHAKARKAVRAWYPQQLAAYDAEGGA